MPVKRYEIREGVSVRKRTKLTPPFLECEVAELHNMLVESTFDSRMAHVETWARSVLTAAGLPDRRGFFVRYPDGRWVEAPKDWETRDLRDFLGRGESICTLGKLVEGKPFTHEWYTVRFLDNLDFLNALIQRGEAARAASFAFTLGRLVQELDFKLDWEPNAITGEKVRAGGKKGAERSRLMIEYRREQHMVWLREDEKLTKELPESGPTERARLIAAKFGANPETVRSAIRRAHQRAG